MTDERDSIMKRFTNILRNAAPTASEEPVADAIPWADNPEQGAPLQVETFETDAIADGDRATEMPDTPAIAQEATELMIDATGYAFEIPISVLEFGTPIGNRADAFAAMIAIRRHDPRPSRQIAAKAGLAPGDPCQVLNDGAYPSDGMLKKYCQLYRIPIDIPDLSGRNIDDSHYEGKGHDYTGPPRQRATPVATGVTLEQRGGPAGPPPMPKAVEPQEAAPTEDAPVITAPDHDVTTDNMTADEIDGPVPGDSGDDARAPVEPDMAHAPSVEVDQDAIDTGTASDQDQRETPTGNAPAHDGGEDADTEMVAPEQTRPETNDEAASPRTKSASAIAAIAQIRKENVELSMTVQDLRRRLEEAEARAGRTEAALSRETARAEAAEAELEAIARALEE